MQQVNFADYLEWGCVLGKHKNIDLGSIQKDGDKVNTMCYTPDIKWVVKFEETYTHVK